MEWFEISNIGQIDTPALAIYPDRIIENIRILKTFVPDTNRLRPHIKTNKSPDVAKLMLEAGINKFKCATIAEAEMLANVGAKDVLLAYQPTGPKIERLAGLIRKYPSTIFSCLVDNFGTAGSISKIFSQENISIQVWIDLNVGMNRTGIKPEVAFELAKHISALSGIKLTGLHAYDGHLRDSDLSVRTEKCDAGFIAVEVLQQKIKSELKADLKIVAGGTPTFPIHAKRENVECSPGTFIFWDSGSSSTLKEQPFLYAALVLTRVVSKPAENILCLDLGHKSIASENPLPYRVLFLNAPELEAVGHSEEHLVVKTNQWERYKVGDALYGVPFHICPTVALHDFGWAVENGKASEQWSIAARKRKINL
jgi:D-serine deaminase-like pyridoxal phosphate-dependent protein